MRFEPTDNHTYRPLTDDDFDEAWRDAAGKKTPGAPWGIHVNAIYYHRVPSSRRRPNRDLLLPNTPITVTQFQKMHESQGGVCAICGGENISGRRLSVDHCHSTGEVRGLLCHNCNVGLGHFKDDPEALKRAAKYLLVVQNP